MTTGYYLYDHPNPNAPVRSNGSGEEPFPLLPIPRPALATGETT